ncbi:MAG: hypothetical protein ACK40O_04025 [Allosphingosinicella sp.]
MAAASVPSRILAFLAAALLAFAAAPAFAAVQITFYSKELGSSFPHAFVTVTGTPDRGGPAVDEDYGFTAKAVTPAILFGRVGGEVITNHTESYVKASDPHFSLTLTDAEFDRVMETVARWRALKQPSYDLDKANCVHFVGEIAAAAGLRIAVRKGLMKKPRSYLEALAALNADWLAGRGATVHRAAAKKAGR